METHAQHKRGCPVPNGNGEVAVDDTEQPLTMSDEEVKIGRPRKREKDKYKKVSIRLHPDVFEWAKAEAEKRGVGYQSVINETLLEHVG